MGKEKIREIREIRRFRYHWQSPRANCSRALEVSTKDILDNHGRNGLYGFLGKFHIWLIHLFRTASITYGLFFLHLTSLYFTFFPFTDIFSTNKIIIFQGTKMERGHLGNIHPHFSLYLSVGLCCAPLELILYFPTVCLLVCLSAWRSVYPSVCLLVCLFVCLSINWSFHRILFKTVLSIFMDSLPIKTSEK